MEYRNPIYNQFGTINVEINHPEFGWIPFTASPNDPDQFGRDVYASIDLSTVAPYVAPPPPPPPTPTVPKSTVMARVIAAGKMGDAQTALWAQPDLFARWFSPDQPLAECDDPDTITFIKALGLDPSVILAP